MNYRIIRIQDELSEADKLKEIFISSVQQDFPQFDQESKERYTSADYLKTILGNHFKYLVLDDDDQAIGYLIAGKPFGGVVFMQWIFTSAGVRKQGIARALFQRLIEDSKAENTHAIHFITRQHLLDFYERIGCECIGVDRKGYFQREDYLMRRYIEA